MKKTWVEKRDQSLKHQVKTNPKRLADMPAGCSMLIPTPKIVDEQLRMIPNGEFIPVKELRKILAKEFNVDMACPLTTGIFLRIVSEAAFEEYQNGTAIDKIAPFWRVVDVKSKMAKKIACGIDFILLQQRKENILT